MKNTGWTVAAICGAAFVMGSLSASAGDAGDPVFPMDMEDKVRAEIMYQRWQRDYEATSDPVQAEGEMDADVLMLRIHTDLGQYAYLDFDAGMVDPTGGKAGFYGGIGLRYLAYQQEGFRVSTFAQVHYAPDASGEAECLDGGDKVDVEYDLWEAEIGVLLAPRITVGDQLTIMPYVGPVVSIMRLDGDVEEADGSRTGFDAEEANVVGGVLGLSLVFPGSNSLRMEAQYFDQVSVSAAASIAF